MTPTSNELSYLCWIGKWLKVSIMLPNKAFPGLFRKQQEATTTAWSGDGNAKKEQGSFNEYERKLESVHLT
jgi:hypothetical protein